MPDGFVVSNGIAPPPFDLPLPDKPELITSNALRLNELIKNPRHKQLFDGLIKHMHEFAQETQITTEEWMTAIQFLTKVGQTVTPLRQEFILLSDVLGFSAYVDAINNPPVDGATESSVLGPFFTEDAKDIGHGESIASEGKGDYMFVEGKVLSATDGSPVSGAVIETWETDGNGSYDNQYEDRTEPDCRGRLRSNEKGEFAYRAVVPIAYPIPADGPVGDLLLTLNRHNMRPAHLHLMVKAEGYRTLVTALYFEGDKWVQSDAVFGSKKSLVVPMKEVNNEDEAHAKGFKNSSKFKYVTYDLKLVPL
ncbi:aromatic compound dioxygenase [Flagelloscypha sp. PMI_526]|nr:aromatic compound dioxygenase [Flagelloscypha sp. PMI_526]